MLKLILNKLAQVDDDDDDDDDDDLTHLAHIRNQ
jgi:hypothetical protein